MEPHRDDGDLTATLSALRPTPREEFAAELDAYAAAGFPSASRRAGSSLAHVAGRFRPMPRRWLLAPATACAVVAIAVATVILTSSGGGPAPSTPTAASGHIAGPAVEKGGPPSAPQSLASSSAKAGASASAEFSAHSGPYASKVAHRKIERAAQIVLGSEPANVRGDATRVYEAVRSVNGIVLNSSVSGGGADEAGARFELLIPSPKLDEALAAFSEIDEVRSQHESTVDVTAKTIGLSERLPDARAKVVGLRAQLARAKTDAERAAVEADLRSARKRVTALRGSLATLQRRTSFSRVSVRIESGNSRGAADGGGWGIDNALRDARHILAVAVAIIVVGLAILAPLALIALLVWLTRCIWVRRERERALG
jgi:Domain of unknown function (DUF4349)